METDIELTSLVDEYYCDLNENGINRDRRYYQQEAQAARTATTTTRKSTTAFYGLFAVATSVIAWTSMPRDTSTSSSSATSRQQQQASSKTNDPCFSDSKEFHQAIGNLTQPERRPYVLARFGPVESWCTSKVSDMSWAFGAHSFAESMTTGSDFNGDISRWDVSRVTKMDYMFYTAHKFNQDLSRWNVERVTSLQSTFDKASSFQQDISSWNVSQVNNMGSLFYCATSFNQDLSSWDVGRVMRMDSTFEGAEGFQQNLCSWNEKVPEAIHFFRTFSHTACQKVVSPKLHNGGPWCTAC